MLLLFMLLGLEARSSGVVVHATESTGARLATVRCKCTSHTTLPQTILHERRRVQTRVSTGQRIAEFQHRREAVLDVAFHDGLQELGTERVTFADTGDGGAVVGVGP